MLRPTVSRSLFLGVKHPSGAQDQIFITLTQLSVCWCGAPALRRGRVCRLQLLLVLARAVTLVSQVPRGSWPYFTVSDSRLPQHGGPGPHIYIPHKQGGPVIAPSTGLSFRYKDLKLMQIREKKAIYWRILTVFGDNGAMRNLSPLSMFRTNMLPISSG
jgi:hypothetical protein